MRKVDFYTRNTCSCIMICMSFNGGKHLYVYTYFRTTYQNSRSHVSINQSSNSYLQKVGTTRTETFDQDWPPCWFPGSEKLGPSRNRQIQRDFPCIPFFRNFRTTSGGCPQFSKRIFQKRSVPFDFVPEFPEILVKRIAPVAKLWKKEKIRIEILTNEA